MHGEFYAVPAECRNSIVFPEFHAPATWCSPNDDPAATIGYSDHVYTRVSDIQIQGIRLPFEILEHASLRSANKNRRARQLDELIPGLDIAEKISVEEINEAKQKLGQVMTRERNAKDAHSKISAEYSDALAERYQLQAEFGV